MSCLSSSVKGSVSESTTCVLGTRAEFGPVFPDISCWGHSLTHFISFHFISFHFISFHFISFHFISFHFISFHFISFYFTFHISHFIFHISYFTFHISYFIFFIFHISYFMFHVSCFMFHLSFVIFHFSFSFCWGHSTDAPNELSGSSAVPVLDGSFFELDRPLVGPCGGTCLLGSSEDCKHVSSLDLRNTGPDCLGTAVNCWSVCCPRGGVEEHLVKGEEELPSAHLLGASFFSGNFGNSFPRSGHHWPHLHGHVLDGGGVLRGLTPVHFVELPELEGRILSRAVLLFDREQGVVFFTLLLVEHVTHQAIPLQVGHVVPPADFGELSRCKVLEYLQLKNIRGSRSFSDSGRDTQ